MMVIISRDYQDKSFFNPTLKVFFFFFGLHYRLNSIEKNKK